MSSDAHDQKKIKDLSRKFIIAYLDSIRHRASQISETDRGLFPFYWFWPSLITIYVNEANDIAISIGRRLSSSRKNDIIRIRKRSGRIEESIFPRLDYAKWPMTRTKKYAHHITLQGGTWNVTDHPFITIPIGCEIKIFEIRVEASVGGYPREFLLVWFFTSPNEKYLSVSRSYEDAEHDFWSKLSSLVFMKTDDIFSGKIYEKTLSLFVESIDRLKDEYHNLITRQDLDEHMLQFILEKYYFLLNPKKVMKKGKRVIGSFRPDFILEFEDDTKTLVEIQLNSDPLIKKGKPSSGLQEAIKQIQDWFEWLELHEPLNLEKYNGLIIIGRKSDYKKNEDLITNILNKIIYPVKLFTYDDLERSIDHVLSELSKVKITPVKAVVEQVKRDL